MRVLSLRRGLRAHERWTPRQLEEHRQRALADLRAFAYARSPFYQRFHRGLIDAPLEELPVLTKPDLMEHFDELVTDRRVRLSDVEAHLPSVAGDSRFLGRYRVVATSGSTGLRGIFLSDPREWATVIASYARAQEWAGVAISPIQRMRLAVVSTRTGWHQSARVGASVRNPLVRTLRLDATDPLADIVARLNEFQPDSLVAYASMHRLLAQERAGGRLRIAPRAVMSASEVLTDDTRRLVTAAWGHPPFDVYAATETAGIGSECDRHTGLHLYDDLVITEIVDEDDRPVPPGEFGARMLVTVLSSRTQPLIRYAMSDSVRRSNEVCPCRRPFPLLDAIQGRQEDVITLPARDGATVEIHPNVFHDVLDQVPAGEWQVVQEGDRLRLLVAGPRSDFDGKAVTSAIRAALDAAGATMSGVTWESVEGIPRTTIGKTPLVRADPSATQALEASRRDAARLSGL
jgi:putative adenylate-forming enzyme